MVSPTNFILTPVVAIDILGVITGLVSIFIIHSSTRGVGGIIGNSLRIFIWGIVAMTLAVVYTLVFTRFKIYPVPGNVDIHHLLMFIGLVLFVISAKKIAALNKKNK